MNQKNNNNNDFLQIVFDHLLDIGGGQCNLTESEVLKVEDEMQRHVLYGLLHMHEEILFSQKELEEKLKSEYQLKLLKEKNQELEHFVYIASHDLKEPVRTIGNFSKLITDKYPVGLDEKAIKYLGFIKDSAERMNLLISNLLEYATLGTKGEQVQFDVEELIGNILLDIKSLIEQKSASFNIGSMPTISGNETLIRLLIQNLIVNAVKFRKPNVDPVIDIFCEVDLTHYRFTVKDNGVGIEEKYLNGIFNIFNRASKASEFEGTGIGLAQCKKIVEMHNGEISVRSEHGVGTEFSFTLLKRDSE